MEHSWKCRKLRNSGMKIEKTSYPGLNNANMHHSNSCVHYDSRLLLTAMLIRNYLFSFYGPWPNTAFCSKASMSSWMTTFMNLLFFDKLPPSCPLFHPSRTKNHHQELIKQWRDLMKSLFGSSMALHRVLVYLYLLSATTSGFDPYLSGGFNHWLLHWLLPLAHLNFKTMPPKILPHTKVQRFHYFLPLHLFLFE